jgi:hypothetical protein
MAKVIEFYVSKRFRNSFVRAGQPQPGQIVEFCSRAKQSVSTRAVVGSVVCIDESLAPNSPRRIAHAAHNFANK